MAFSLRYTLTFPCKSLRFQHNKFLQSDCILNFSNLITIFPVIANFYIFIFTLYFLSLVTRFSLYAKRCHKYFFGCLYCPKKCPLVSFAPFLLMDIFWDPLYIKFPFDYVNCGQHLHLQKGIWFSVH